MTIREAVEMFRAEYMEDDYILSAITSVTEGGQYCLRVFTLMYVSLPRYYAGFPIVQEQAENIEL